MRLLCLGDNVVDRYVAQGVMYPGGNAVNVAVFAKRLGADAAYQGVLGSDEAGRLVLASLVGEGVDTSRVTVAQGPNAWADVELVEGDRLFLGSDKGVSNFRLTATHYAEVAAFDAVHTAYTALLEDQLFDLCTHAARVSYDFGRNFTPEQVGRLTPGLWLASFSGSHLSERLRPGAAHLELAGRRRLHRGDPRVTGCGPGHARSTLGPTRRARPGG